MKTAIKFLFSLICIAFVSGVSASPLAANKPSYTVTIPCQFDGSAGEFYNGLAVIENGGKSGLIDKAGNVIVPFVYDSIYSNNSSSDREIPVNDFIVVKNGKRGVLDKSGKIVIPCNYDSIRNTGTGIAIVGIGEPRPPGGGTIRGLWGLIDLQTGNEILPVKYREISPSDDFLLYTVYTENGAGVIDKAGNFIIPIGTYDFIANFNSGFTKVSKNGRWGLINRTGSIVVPLTYNEIDPRNDMDQFSNSVVTAVKNDKYGVLNISGEIVIPFNFDYGRVYANGIIEMQDYKEDVKMTIFESTGKVIAPAGQYDYIHDVSGDLIYVEYGEKVGAIDITGKEIVPFIYTGVRETKNGLATVISDDKSAVINQSGKVILPLDSYGNIVLHDDGYIHVMSMNNKWLLNDYSGNTVFAGEYDFISNMSNGYMVVNNQEGYAIINKDGDIIVPFGEFNSIDFRISENMVAVHKDGLVGYITLPDITPPDDWAKPEIDRAIAEGLIPEDMCRKYQDNITRADFCRLAINLIEKITGMKIDAFMGTRGMAGRVSDPIAFTDTDDPAIMTASRLGIVNGVGNNKFDPTGTIKRQDAAVMLYQMAKLLDYTEPNGTPEVFADRDNFSSYAVDAIDFVSAIADKEKNNKVMGSVDNNNFSPLDTFTREQAYISILRFYNYILTFLR